MLFLKIISYALIILIQITIQCHAIDDNDVQLIHTGDANTVPYSPKIESTMGKCNGSITKQGKTHSYGLKLHLPFMDIDIQNQRNMRILHEPQKRLIFILHGNELFQMFISREEKRLTLIAILDGNGVANMEHIGAEIIAWHDYFFLVIALEDYVEVYQIAESTIVDRAKIAKDPKRSDESVPHFEPIQELMLLGKYRKIYLIKSIENRLLLIMAVGFTKLHGQIKTFEWIDTYFEPIEEKTVPPLHILSLVGKPPRYLIIGRNRSKLRTLFTMYEFDATTRHLKTRQTFNVETRTPHILTQQGKNYIISCSKNAKKCSIYKMFDGRFNVYRQGPSKDLYFTQIIAGEHYLVGTRLNETLVFPNILLSCYSAFRSNESDVSSIIGYSNEHGEDFILLNYRRPFNTLVRVVQVESESAEVLGKTLILDADIEEMNQQKQSEHNFEDTIKNLRSLLLIHKSAMDVFKKITNFYSPKLKSIKLANPVTLRSGNIGVVKLVGKDLRSPVQLLVRVRDLAKRYETKRTKRDLTQFSHNRTALRKYPLRVKQLKVSNLLYKHDLIAGFHLNKTNKLLTINSQIKTQVLNTAELLLRSNVRKTRQPSLGLFDFGTKIKRVRKLFVNTINQVKWSDFYNSIFLKNRDKKIKGRLVLQSMTSVENLWTSSLNGLVVENLFNLVQPQVIRSSILVNGFFVSDLQADLINGLDFAKDIVFSGVDNVITTPVVMQQLIINGDLQLMDNSTQPRFSHGEAGNFQQMYTGKVVINGSLTINNLWTEDKGEVKVADIRVSAEAIREKFLLNKTEQHFAYPISFENARIDAPSLNTNFLNEHPTTEHLLKTAGTTEAKNATTPLMLIFMRAHIKGQLICNSYNSSLAKLSANAIRHGVVVNITGIKHFEAPLIIDNLMTIELNDLPVSELILKKELNKPLTLKGNKTFEKIIITGNADIDVALNANYLNSLPLRELLNYDYHLENLTVPHKLYATNIVFHKINSIPFDKVFINFKIKDDHLVLHKDLIIEGNAKFDEKLTVDWINNIDWNAYQQSLVRQHEDALINGTKHFRQETVILKELNVPTWNNMRVMDIFDNILQKSKPQVVSGVYSFDELCVSNVDVGVINNVPVSAFIDTQTKEIVIEGDIVVPKIKVHGDLNGTFVPQMDLSKLVQLIKELPSKPWRNIHVLGNAQWNSTAIDRESTQEQQLAYLYKNAVTTTGNHTISGNVKLKLPIITQMHTKTNFPSDIDFKFIAKDALLRNTTARQIITAPKHFARPLIMQNMTVYDVLATKLLNGIDILLLNATLYRLSSGAPIIGPIRFRQAPIIGHLGVEGTLNGLRTQQIYHQPNVTLPPVKMRSLTINNTLQLQDVNDMSLDYLLRNRITKNGEALEVFGFLTFENLILNKEILLRSINGIPMESVIVKESPNLQSITGPKIIAGDLVLAGPAHVMRLNDQELIESYQQSIFTNADYVFDNLMVEQATFERGLRLTREMLGEPHMSNDDANAILRTLETIDNDDNENDSIIRNKTHLMYLDYDFELQTKWQRPVANITIDKTYDFVINRLTICERVLLHAQISLANQTIYLHNTTSNIIASQSNDYSVMVENYCKTKHRKLRSKITLTTPTYRRAFGLKKFIENVELFTTTANQTYLLLHAVDLIGQSNEVRLLQLNNSNEKLIDRQSLTEGIGKVLRLFQFSKNYTLLISASMVKNNAAITLYTYSLDKAQFELTQVIAGDYDIIEMQQIATQRYQLLLSCIGCQCLSIYEFDAKSAGGMYRIYQLINLHQRIDRLLTFSVNDNSRYLLLLSEHEEDFYHLYNYSHIQGWLNFTYGYFHNIQHALPLVKNGQVLNGRDDDMLLLLCGGSSEQQCRLVKVIVQ